MYLCNKTARKSNLEEIIKIAFDFCYNNYSQHSQNQVRQLETLLTDSWIKGIFFQLVCLSVSQNVGELILFSIEYSKIKWITKS